MENDFEFWFETTNLKKAKFPITRHLENKSGNEWQQWYYMLFPENPDLLENY